MSQQTFLPESSANRGTNTHVGIKSNNHSSQVPPHSPDAPLAARIRPQTLDGFVGQNHLVGDNGPIKKLIDSDRIPSMIFWGPPGCGKTTLASVIANHTKSRFISMSAVDSGKADVKKIIDLAQKDPNTRTILFLDEIHRFNKAQQDFLLPYVEKGTLTLIGATTENPSFEVNSALLSRSRVFVLNQHSEDDLLQILDRGIDGLKDTVHVKVSLTKDAVTELIQGSNGDPRALLNALEMALDLARGADMPTAGKIEKTDSKEKMPKEKKSQESLSRVTETQETKSQETNPQETPSRVTEPQEAKPPEKMPQEKTKQTRKICLTKKNIADALQRKSLLYDKDGEEHYNIISALHKSMRSSDPNASLYWLARMLEAGEDPLYVARRMLRFAAEDVGNADPQATILANAAFGACQKIGMPECNVHLAQLAIYLANAPKDNSAYAGYAQARKDAENTLNLPVPMHLRNAETDLMKDVGYGKGYVYDHDVPNKKSGQQCLPDKLKDRKYV